MKYWTELMELENASIDLESAVATFKAVNCAIQELSAEEMQLAYWNIEKQLVNINWSGWIIKSAITQKEEV